MRICAVELNFILSMLLLSLLAIKRKTLAQPTGRTAQCTWKRGTENNSSSQLSKYPIPFLGWKQLFDISPFSSSAKKYNKDQQLWRIFV
jgi:hypothetical protein